MQAHHWFLREYVVTILNDELNGNVLGVHISHFSFNVRVSHNCGREDHGQISRCHLPVLVMLNRDKNI